MASLDTTIGNIAAPSIARDLHVGSGTTALAVAAYTLLYASTLITGARLGADRGRRRLFLLGITVFTLASTVAGLAPNAVVLVAARATQGFGAALAIPQAIAFIQADFSGAARARALSIYSVTISIGAGAGLVAGGALIDLDVAGLGWRAVFLINLPIGLVVLSVASRVLPRIEPSRRRLDTVGVILLTSGAALVTGPLALAANAGLPVRSWICLFAGSALLAAFWSWQHTQQAPLLDPAILGTPGVRPGLAVLLLTGTTYTGTLYCVASELQQHHGSTPLAAGLALLPFIAGYGIGSGGGAIVSAARHRALIVAGVGCLAGNLVVLGALAGGHWPDNAAPILLAGAGLGYGACFNPTLGLTMSHVSRQLVPDVTGVATTTFQFSFVLGVAVFGSSYAAGSIAWALIAMGAAAALAIPVAYPASRS